MNSFCIVFVFPAIPLISTQIMSMPQLSMRYEVPPGANELLAIIKFLVSVAEEQNTGQQGRKRRRVDLESYARHPWHFQMLLLASYLAENSGRYEIAEK